MYLRLTDFIIVTIKLWCRTSLYSGRVIIAQDFCIHILEDRVSEIVMTTED